jgi:ribosomal protein S18 acetylase RimI-like enzyme
MPNPLGKHVQWRHLTHDDVPAWATLLANAELVDKTGEHYNEGDLHEEMDDPATGTQDRIGGFVDGILAANAGVRPRADASEFMRIEGEGYVDPRWRGQGLGTEGVRWIIERSNQIHAERAPDVVAKVQLLGYPDNPGQIELIESQGFAAVNWSAGMRAQLDDGRELATSQLPAGFTLLPYDLSWSARTRAAHNVAFQDHWGSVAWDEQMWQQWVDGSKNFRPDFSWVVVDDADPEVVVAYVQSNEFDAYEANTGRREAYLSKIGVRRGYRGRGLASTLLRYAMRAYREAGYVECSLDVDTNNPTGAFGLYERAGFEVETRKTIYEIEIPASGEAGLA